MSDDFGTVNLKRDSIGREFESLRRKYHDHLELLERMMGEAPTEHLAQRYGQLHREVQQSLDRLTEIERGTPSRPPVASTPYATAERQAPRSWSERDFEEAPPPPTTSGADARRALLILVLGILVLAALGYVAWRYLGDDGAAVVESEELPETVVEEAVPDAEEATTGPPSTTATAGTESLALLRVSPPSHDFGTVAKGTRAVRQFQLTNTTSQPMKIALERSQCRCLWFDYDATIPPNATVMLAVTVDGALAERGPVNESIDITSSTHPRLDASIDVTANVR